MTVGTCCIINFQCCLRFCVAPVMISCPHLHLCNIFYLVDIVCNAPACNACLLSACAIQYLCATHPAAHLSPLPPPPPLCTTVRPRPHCTIPPKAQIPCLRLLPRMCCPKEALTRGRRLAGGLPVPPASHHIQRCGQQPPVKMPAFGGPPDPTWCRMWRHPTQKGLNQRR